MSTAPKKDEKAQADAPTFKKIKVSAFEPHWRGGVEFGKDVTELNVEDLDEEKLQQILNDPRLKVEKV